MTNPLIEDLTLEAIRARWHALAGDIVRTPMVPMEGGVPGAAATLLKLETVQHTGTFKARGALSSARAIPPDRRAAGITAASAGNHAIAAAWAARASGIAARVVMQNTANPFRVARARDMGAEVILRDPGAATFGEAERLSREEGMTFIHPFDGRDTVLGTGGIGLEMLKDAPDLDAVVVSVGGAGLIGGVAAAIKLTNPACAVYGVEPEGADSMARSLAAGAPVTLDRVQTVADSLAPPMALPLGHALCAAYVDDIVRVSDDAICGGMVILAEDAKLAVEPAAGAAIAGAYGPLRDRLAGKRVGVIVCGANIDARGYAELAARGIDPAEALRAG